MTKPKKNEPQPTEFGKRIQTKLRTFETDPLKRMSLREAERESGISKDTIRRAIFHVIADLEVTVKFCVWLECDMETALEELGLTKRLNLKNRLMMSAEN